MASREKLQLMGLEVPANIEEFRAPELHGGSVHLWYGETKSGGQQPWTEKLLSSDEVARRERFHFEDDQKSFAFCRGLLRTVLAAYCGADPRELRFCYSERGKPSLAGTGAEAELQFNLSHTRGAVMLGISRRRAVGVDVERVREDLRPREIAARFFSVESPES